MILIIGATGTFGSRVAARLAGSGEQVRGLVRDSHKGAGLRAAGVELVIGDLDRGEDVARAVEGARRIFLSSPTHPLLAEREQRVIQAAQQAGVERIVKVSGAALLDGHPLIPGHTEAVEALRFSGVDWTVVSPAPAMETLLGIEARVLRSTGSMYGCTDGERLALVAADDVARASVSAVRRAGQCRLEFELTGPESLSLDEVALRVVARQAGPFRIKR